MGGFTPEKGTMYRELLDQTRVAFGIDDFDKTDREPCFGDPGGGSVHCRWHRPDLELQILTPQSYGSDDRDGRTAGVLRLSKVVQTDAADLEWINLAQIVQVYGIPTTADEFQRTARRLQLFAKNDSWRPPNQLILPFLSDDARKATLAPSGVRWFPLFCNPRQRLFVVQAKGPCFGGFDCPPGFMQGARLTAEQRYELFLYEFQLTGRHSFAFQIAR